MKLKSKVLLLGSMGSLFFSLTFILNRNMSLDGSNFIWSASLRYMFSFPLLFLIIIKNSNISKIHRVIKSNLYSWILWSNVGFTLFYLPLCFSSNYGSSWLVAANWQVTIVFGTLLNPLFKQKIPIKSLIYSILILSGVIILQFDNISNFNSKDVIFCIIPVTIAAIAYPLGNRKIMSITSNSLSTIERIYAMTVCTMPTWAILSIITYFNISRPTNNQILQSLIVAIFSAIIATLLFFTATDIAKLNPSLLSLAESTIALEVIFTTIGGILFLHDPLPNILGWIGLSIIIIGIILMSKKNIQ